MNVYNYVKQINDSFKYSVDISIKIVNRCRINAVVKVEKKIHQIRTVDKVRRQS